MQRLATRSLLRIEQAESFAANGFLTFEHLVSDDELRELKKPSKISSKSVLEKRKVRTSIWSLLASQELPRLRRRSPIP